MAKVVEKEPKVNLKELLRKDVLDCITNMTLPEDVSLLGMEKASVFLRAKEADVEIAVVIKKDRVLEFEDATTNAVIDATDE